jgi:hypothetical protein
MAGTRRVAVVLAGLSLVLLPVAGCGARGVLELQVGDCLHSSDLRAEPAVDVAVDCGEPHDAEIFAATQMPDGPYPGLEAVRAAADDFCLPLFADFVGIEYLDSDLDVYPLLPTEDGWNSAGDREILCVLVAPEDVTGTLEGSAR